MTPSALFTDFYELTMMAGYADAGLADAPATFDLFFRRPPEGVSVLVSAGQQLALDFLEALRFTDEDLAYLRTTPLPAAFVDSLADLRFTGDVHAVPEGTPVFANEPVLRVEAPLAQAQLVETALLNAICYSSLVASNAAEVRLAAGDRGVLEFGARRAHGPDGALSASRAAFVGGCDSTSNVEAGHRFGIPVSGTQAHAWVMAFPSELESFRAYATTFPDACVLLVDTYDTLGVGVPNAITVAREMRARGQRLQGIRLDSGDLSALATGAREQLDAAGFEEVQIVASGDLDARRVAELCRAGAPIDSFGVGTALVTAKQDPTISGVYKLAHLADVDVAKISSNPGKTTDPGRKQVWRTDDGDVIGLADEDRPGTPLLNQVMADGRRIADLPDLARIRAQAIESRGWLQARCPEEDLLRWPVRRSQRLDDLREAVLADMADGIRGEA
ncbi:nicotinate phosphoribosyltransferase [Euzebya sp.]|uniref:nicotinate phosphoribosyltransferase n=1 Tax=Euzebya sp. TaxID=1971409 RepID=UPI003511A525